VLPAHGAVCLRHRVCAIVALMIGDNMQYDRPSSFFGQHGDNRATEVGRYLDAALEAILRNAAE
jgi:hypothetical protein